MPGFNPNMPPPGNPENFTRHSTPRRSRRRGRSHIGHGLRQWRRWRRVTGEIFGSSTPAMLYPLEMAARAYHAKSYRGPRRLLLGQMASGMPMGACRVRWHRVAHRQWHRQGSVCDWAPDTGAQALIELPLIRQSHSACIGSDFSSSGVMPLLCPTRSINVIDAIESTQ